jgi:hypothetical protein
VYHIRITLQKEDVSGNVLDHYERETLVADEDVDEVTFGLNPVTAFCSKHLHHLIWGMLLRDREERSFQAGPD